MKILQVIPTLGSGGAERFVVDLSNELVANGHEVILCTLFDINKNSLDSFFLKELDSKIKIISLNKSLGFDIKVFYKLYQVIKKNKPDIIHSHLAVLNYLLPSTILYGKKKFFHTLHNDASMLVENTFSRVNSNFMYKNKFLTPICISDESLKSFEKLYGKQQNAKLIYNGRKLINKTKEYDETKIFFDTIKKDIENPLVFVNIGRVYEQKNHLCLVETFSELSKSHQNIILIIIGEGDKEMFQKLKEYESKNIYILGRKSNAIDYLSLSDVFILPSLYEGMPISLIEAMYNKCFAICSPVGGMINVINKNNGYLLKGYSQQDIKEGILHYLKLSQAEKETIINNAYQDAIQKYSIEQCCNNYIKVFQQK